MKLYLLLLALPVLLPAVDSVGQKPEEDDDPVGIFQSQSEYFEFMGGAKRVAYGPDGSPELQAMIPLLNDIALNKPVGWTAGAYNTTGSTLGLLSNADIRAEIEMLDDQYKELQELGNAIQKRSAEQVRRLDFKDRENLVKQIRSIRDQATSDLNAVLLPHQLDRLKQIAMQSHLRRRSLVDMLTSDPLKSDLEITDSQSKALRQEEKKIEADLSREIAKLREKARDRLVSRLNPAQQVEVKAMIGDAFRFSLPSKNDGRDKSNGARTKRK